MWSVVIPAIAFITDQESLSVAFGVQASVGSTSIFLFTTITGSLSEMAPHRPGVGELEEQIAIQSDYKTLYFEHIMIFMFFVLATLASILLLIFSIKYKHLLYPSELDQEIDEQEKEEQEQEKEENMDIEEEIHDATSRIRKSSSKFYKRKSYTLPSVHIINRYSTSSSARYINEFG